MGVYIPTPLKKYLFVSWDDEIPNIWKDTCSKLPDHQPIYIYISLYVIYIYICICVSIYIYIYIWIIHDYTTDQWLIATAAKPVAIPVLAGADPTLARPKSDDMTLVWRGERQSSNIRKELRGVRLLTCIYIYMYFRKVCSTCRYCSLIDLCR